MFDKLLLFVKLQLIIILDLVNRLKKIFKFIQTGKHEFERICESQCDTYEKTMQFDEWLRRTKCAPVRKFLDKTFNKKSTPKTSLPLRTIEQCLQRYTSPVGCLTSGTQLRRKSLLPPSGPPARVACLEDAGQTLSSTLDKLVNELVRTIQKAKRTSLSANCEESLRDMLQRILFYDLTLMFGDRLAATKYDQEIDSHVDKLISLWNNLIEADSVVGANCRQTNQDNDTEQPNAFPEELRGKKISNSNDIVSSRWSHIGFQGSDPGTDFRGMGILGLAQLEYLSRRPNKLAVDLLRRSSNEKHSYPFAIVGINITYNLLCLFRDGSMKHLYYDNGDSLFAKNKRLNLVTTLNDLYVELFLRFDCFWHQSEPENIFAFRELIGKFISVIRYDLCNRNFGFKFSY